MAQMSLLAKAYWTVMQKYSKSQHHMAPQDSQVLGWNSIFLQYNQYTHHYYQDLHFHQKYLSGRPMVPYLYLQGRIDLSDKLVY